MIAIPTKSGRTDPDAQLMVRAGRGDQAAFETLVDQYYDRVVFVIEHLLGNSGQSDDLAQEVFLRVYRARETYRPESKFSTWLFVIVNNVVRNARRSLARRREVHLREVPGKSEILPETALNDHRFPAPPDATLCGELGITVQEAIEKLNSRQRTAILLYHFGGFSYAEVAERMDTTLCAAKALLHRARGTLRGRLNGYASV